MKTTLFTLALATCLGSSAWAQESLSPVQVAKDTAEVLIVGQAPFVADQVIVRFVEGIEFDAASQLLDGDRYSVMEELVPALNMFLVHINDGTRVAAAIEALSGLPAVMYANPDGISESRDTLPNDPSYGQQWAHTKMQSAKAWDFGTGSAQFVVSVVDGGCMITHTDIAPNLFKNMAEVNGAPGVDDDGNGYVDDKNGWNAYNNNGTIPNDGHGTHCNGIAGARGNNGAGVAGVNWTTSLMPVAGSSGTTSVITKAYNYVYTQKNLWINTGGAKGANVVVTSNSFGIDQGNCLTTYKAWNDLYNLMGSVGILSCGATANANWNIDAVQDTPTGCASNYMVSVTNTTSSDVKSTSAGYGLTTIDLGAPGTSIYSTYSSGGYTNLTGTSMACPQVAGAIGFLHSVASAEFATLRGSNPAQAAVELKTVILNSVDPLPSLAGKTVSGGRINLFKATQAISNWTAGGTGTAGTIVPYGVGLGGANIGTLSSTSIPNLGTLLVLDASGFNNSSILRMVFSTSQVSQSAYGGTLLVNFAAAVVDQYFPVSGGVGSFSIQVPASPSYVGFVVYAQCGGLDPTQPLKTAMSNGLVITLGQ